MSATVNLQLTTSALVAAGIELAVAAIVCGVVYLLVLAIVRGPSLRTGRWAGWSNAARVKTRNFLLVLWLAATATVLAYNGWLLAHGVDPARHTMAFLQSITMDTWRSAGIVIGKVALAVAAALVVTRILRRLMQATERGINRWDQLKDNNKSLAALFRGLDRAMVNVGWLLVITFTAGLVAAPSQVIDTLLLVLRVYVVFAVGLAVIRSTAVITDTLDGLSRRYTEKRGWERFYDPLRPLVPTFRVCLEYALWIALASLIIVQVEVTRALAVWGPRVIQAIGIFFASRVVIELGRLELGRRILPDKGIDETERRRRITILPLVRTAFTYSVYFGAGVLMLSALGFNPMPFLAGAGIVGLVVGFGAQSLIDDVVSGFFILFENTYYVGEMIKVGNQEIGVARGVVEAIEFRTTRLRDTDGRVHTVRNGNVKPVVNYSREFSTAVVDLRVEYDADLKAVFATIRQAADGLRATHPDVLDDTEIEGIAAFEATHMVVRAQTRVKPGSGDSVAAALRFAIKELFDRHARGAPRRTLVPKSLGGGDASAHPYLQT